MVVVYVAMNHPPTTYTPRKTTPTHVPDTLLHKYPQIYLLAKF